MSNKIVELMQVVEEKRDLDWLKRSLQAAIELELSTLPPYLSGLWSIKAGSGPVYDLVESVAIEEMVHMGLACNMLTALGVAPSIFGAFQQEIKYPGPLPGGVRPQLTVYLAGLSREYIKDVYMQIEYPEQGPVALALGENYPTIGAFYDAILGAFTRLKPALSQKNQLAACFGQEQLPCPDDMLQVFVVSTLDDVEEAIHEIKEQGEGTSQSPESPDFGKGPVPGQHEFAHYYKYAEVYHGATLVQVGKEWKYSGAPIPFPDVYAVTRIPEGGYKKAPPNVRQALNSFNQQFAGLLQGLENAWANGSQDDLQNAINTMFNLPQLATTIMQIPTSDRMAYGPDFDVSAVSPS